MFAKVEPDKALFNPREKKGWIYLWEGKSKRRGNTRVIDEPSGRVSEYKERKGVWV